MSFFRYLTPFSYWLLILLWTCILIFYMRRIISKKLRNRFFHTLMVILAIDAFRTLFESIYFGAWYTSKVGLLSQSIYDFLVLPQNVFVPKAINIIAAALVIAILLKRWIPQETEEIQRQLSHTKLLEAEVARRTTELKSAYEALARANEKLRTLDRLKSAFIDVTSHELRTPLTCVIGHLNLLERKIPDTSEDLFVHTKSALKSSQRLERMIINALKLSDLERYDKHLELTPVDIRKVFDDAYMEVESFARLRRQRIEFETPECFPTIQVDLDKIHDVLVNLLLNAIKFTPDEGCIHVQLVQREQDFLEIHVRDEGAGVEEPDQAHVFDKFFSGFDVAHHSSGDYQFLTKGIGLGLAIVQKFVEMHGGKVGMASRAGRGSDFYFTLPSQKVGTV